QPDRSELRHAGLRRRRGWFCGSCGGPVTNCGRGPVVKKLQGRKGPWGPRPFTGLHRYNVALQPIDVSTLFLDKTVSLSFTVKPAPPKPKPALFWNAATEERSLSLFTLIRACM